MLNTPQEQGPFDRPLRRAFDFVREQFSPYGGRRKYYF